MKLSWVFDTAPTALAVAAAISGGVLLLVSLVAGFARRKLYRAAETQGDVDDFLLDVVRRTSVALLVIRSISPSSTRSKMKESSSRIPRGRLICNRRRRRRLLLSDLRRRES